MENQQPICVLALLLAHRLEGLRTLQQRGPGYLAFALGRNQRSVIGFPSPLGAWQASVGKPLVNGGAFDAAHFGNPVSTQEVSGFLYCWFGSSHG